MLEDMNIFKKSSIDSYIKLCLKLLCNRGMLFFGVYKKSLKIQVWRDIVILILFIRVKKG